MIWLIFKWTKRTDEVSVLRQTIRHGMYAILPNLLYSICCCLANNRSLVKLTAEGRRWMGPASGAPSILPYLSVPWDPEEHLLVDSIYSTFFNSSGFALWYSHWTNFNLTFKKYSIYVCGMYFIVSHYTFSYPSPISSILSSSSLSLSFQVALLDLH